MRVISGYAAKGHKVVLLRSDNEGCAVASQHILGLQGIDVELSDPESYIFIVESKIRWIKERARTILFSNQYEPPDSTIPWLPKFIAYSINIVPHSRSGKVPREELTGIRTDARRDMRACWGDIVELYKTPKIMNSMQERSITCIALSPSGNSTGSWFLLSLHSGSVVKGYRWSDRKFDELALKTISEMNKRDKALKITEKPSGSALTDQIPEPTEPILAPQPFFFFTTFG